MSFGPTILAMPIRRLLSFAVLCAAAMIVAAPASADGPVVDVVEISGPIDARLTEFVEQTLAETDAILVVLQVNSEAAVDDAALRLIDLVADPRVPLVVWVGPQPAVAQGVAARVLAVAPIRAAAPGVLVGHMAPGIAGSGETAEAVAGDFPGMADLGVVSDRIEIGVQPVPGLVDIVSPSIGQLIVGLHGHEVLVRGEIVTLSTAVADVAEDGSEVLRPSQDVRFSKPGIITRSLRLAIDPEMTFMFLVAGLAFIVFETYAAGPGLAAAVGVLSLLISGYGLAVLPVNWWALAATLAGILAYTIDFQRNDLGWKSLLGTGLLLYGGLALVDGGDQIHTSWWAIVLIVLGAALFFGFALTTVARARFSTQTIGREHLIGKVGTAGSDFDHEGIVVLDDARWRGRTERAANIAEGDPVTVVAVDGIVLEVEPARE